MQIDDAMVSKIAKLAKIELNKNEVRPMVKYMEELVGYIQQLSEVDTTSVLGTYSSLREMSPGVPHVDKPSMEFKPLGAQVLLSNAPSKDGAQFAVKAVIEEQ